MADATLGPLAALSAGSTILNNAMSEWHADQQMAREKKLMNYQNQLNRANALSAYQTQVEGMRLAGLSPALLSGQTPQIAAPVSKGSVSQGENVEFDPATLLLDAQIKNVNADTEVKQAEAAKISGVDTENTIADTLLKGASTSEKNALTERTNQINTQWTDQNKALEEQGKVIAQKWQSTKWYNMLAPDTRNTIDAMATGEIPLTVGGMDALSRSIKSQTDLSDADRKLVDNGFANAVTGAIFDNKEVFDSIVEKSLNDANLSKAQRDKILVETDKIKYRMKEIIDETIDKIHSDTNVNNATYWMKLKEKLAFEYESMDLSRAEGRYGNYAWRVMEKLTDRLMDLLQMFLPAGILRKGMKEAANAKQYDGPPIYSPTPREMDTYGNPLSTHIAPPAGGTVNLFRPSGIESFRR